MLEMDPTVGPTTTTTTTTTTTLLLLLLLYSTVKKSMTKTMIVSWTRAMHHKSMLLTIAGTVLKESDDLDIW